MRVRTHLLPFAAGLILIGLGAASAQTAGTTSGPAVGTPATLGPGGVTTATPHQADTIRNGGGAPVQGERTGQVGGTAATIKPGASDAGSGVTPKPQ